MLTPEEPLTDQVLVQRCRSEDNAARTLLYRCHDGLVRAVIARALRGTVVDLNRVDEVASAFWYRLFFDHPSGLDEYDGQRPLRQYLAALAWREVCLDGRERRWQARKEGPLPPDDVVDGGAQDGLAAAHVRECLARLPEILTEPQRAVLEERLLSDKGGPRTCAMTEGYVQKLTRRVLQRLLGLLGDGNI